MTTYDEAARDASAVGEVAVRLIETRLAEAPLSVHAVRWRVKSRESAEHKAKSLGIAVDEIVDLLGVRVTTFDEGDIDIVWSLLAATFDVSASHRDLGVSTLAALDAQAVHATVRLPTQQQSGGPNIPFEIQVRSLLGEEIAELEHLLRYKGTDGRASALALRKAALLELRQHHATQIAEFRALLDSNPAEEDLQRYLNTHRILLAPSARSVIAKHRLGSEFVTDFVIDLGNGEYEFVELEPSTVPLFTKAGDPTKFVTHAQRQVEDWREWVQTNLQYARHQLPGLSDPRCRIIIGRWTLADQGGSAASSACRSSASTAILLTSPATPASAVGGQRQHERW